MMQPLFFWYDNLPWGSLINYWYSKPYGTWDATQKTNLPHLAETLISTVPNYKYWLLFYFYLFNKIFNFWYVILHFIFHFSSNIYSTYKSFQFLPFVNASIRSSDLQCIQSWSMNNSSHAITNISSFGAADVAIRLVVVVAARAVNAFCFNTLLTVFYLYA